MIPKTDRPLIRSIRLAEPPAATFRIREDAGVITGMIDGAEAVRQAVWLILNVERYQYLIHSWNYGVEFSSLYGKPIPFVLPELERRIAEALTQDSRIRAVRDFKFATGGRKIGVSFIVDTIYGAIPAERTVDI